MRRYTITIEWEDGSITQDTITAPNKSMASLMAWENLDHRVIKYVSRLECSPCKNHAKTIN